MLTSWQPSCKIVVAKSYICSSPCSHTTQTPVITGITVSSYCLGALGGCIVNFFIGDMFGRRRMIWIAMGLILVGASLQASAYKLGHLIAGRVVTGFGTGIDSSTVPMYQSELSKKEWRGRLVSWEIWFIGKIVIQTEDYPTLCSDLSSKAWGSAWPIGLIMASRMSTAQQHGARQLPSNSCSPSLSSLSSGAVPNRRAGWRNADVGKKPRTCSAQSTISSLTIHTS